MRYVIQDILYYTYMYNVQYIGESNRIRTLSVSKKTINPTKNV